MNDNNRIIERMGLYVFMDYPIQCINCGHETKIIFAKMNLCSNCVEKLYEDVETET